MSLFSYFVKLRIGRDVGFADLARERFGENLGFPKSLVEFIHIISHLSYRLGLSSYRVFILTKRNG